MCRMSHKVDNWGKSFSPAPGRWNPYFLDDRSPSASSRSDHPWQASCLESNGPTSLWPQSVSLAKLANPLQTCRGSFLNQ